jgi:hypothetical protein
VSERREAEGRLYGRTDEDGEGTADAGAREKTGVGRGRGRGGPRTAHGEGNTARRTGGATEPGQPQGTESEWSGWVLYSRSGWLRPDELMDASFRSCLGGARGPRPRLHRERERREAKATGKKCHARARQRRGRGLWFPKATRRNGNLDVPVLHENRVRCYATPIT